MNILKLSFVFLFLFGFLSSFISCKRENSPSNSEQSSLESFELKKDFSISEKKKVTMKISSESAQGKSETKQIFEYTTNKKIIRVSNDGSFVFERTPVRFSVEQKTISGQTNSPHGNFLYDSVTSPDSEIPNHLWTQAKEVGEILTLEISPKGEILSLSDSSQFKKKLLEKGRVLFGDQYIEDPVNRNQLEEYYKESAIQQRLLSEMEIFISLSDKVGKTWKMENLLPGNIQQISKYIYQSDEDGFAKVKLEIEQKLLDQNVGDQMNSLPSNFGYIKADGSTIGTIWVIKGTGWIHHGSLSQNLHYDMEITDPLSGKKEIYTSKYQNQTEYSF
jgi:hypothetical protein